MHLIGVERSTHHQFAAGALADIDVQAARDKNLIQPWLHWLAHHRLQWVNVDRGADTYHISHTRRKTGHRTQHLAGFDRAARCLHTDHFASDYVNAGDRSLLMNFNAALAGAATITPRYRVMTRDCAGCVIQGAEYGRMTTAGDVNRWAGPFDEIRTDQLRFNAVVFVDLSAPAHGAHCRVRVRQGEVATGRVEHIEIEVFRQILPQSHRGIIKLHALGRQVVGANDRGVAAGVTAADIALFQYRDTLDAVVAR